MILRWLSRLRRPFISSHAPDDPLELLVTRNIEDFLRFARTHGDLVEPRPPGPDTLAGRCQPCRQDTVFGVRRGHDGSVNWRETLECAHCGMINRWRSGHHLFERICRPDQETRVFITEAITALHDRIAQRYPETTGSEFSHEAAPGEQIVIGERTVTMQDITRLTHPDRSFDCVLSFDVLEHVPDYCAALAEFARVLDRRGWLLLSVPFSFAEETEVRAVLEADGSVRHVLPPDYHGDPTSNEGILCYQSFGMDLLDAMRAVGFRHTALVAFASREWGYLGANVMFVGRKR